MKAKDEAVELRAAIAAVQSRGGFPRYGLELRERAVRLLTERQRRGETSWTLSAELGLPWQTLRRWEVAVAAGPKASFRRVAVAQEEAAPAGPGFVLRGPSGVSVTGLTVEELSVLLRSLSS
jgi:hypothetical protein